MYPIECVVCHGRFQAKRETARYCSDRCRKRRQRAGVSADAMAALPERREGPPVVALPKREPDEFGILGTTRRELEEAGRLNTSKGQAALLIATILDSGIQDTGSSIAALIRQHQASLEAALDGAVVKQSPAERIRSQRERRSA